MDKNGWLVIKPLLSVLSPQDLRDGGFYVENLDDRTSAKGMFRKPMLDAGFGQFRSFLKWVCWQRGKFFAEVDARQRNKPTMSELWNRVG